MKNNYKRMKLIVIIWIAIEITLPPIRFQYDDLHFEGGGRKKSNRVILHGISLLTGVCAALYHQKCTTKNQTI